jgi:cobalt transporter subunit CbtA
MIGRTLFAAVLAGIAAGFVMSAVQMWQVMPLIMHAESYEHGAAHAAPAEQDHEHGHSHSHDTESDHGHSHSHEADGDHGHAHDGEADHGHGHSHSHEAETDHGHSHDNGHGAGDEASGHGHTHDGWMPEDGIERTTFTILANVITGVGFALVLMAAVMFSGREITIKNGLVWGTVGFFVFAVAPAAGLPPELPGMGGGEIAPRQVWWIATAAATAVGIAAIVMWSGVAAKAAGVVLIALPHIVGAPVEPALDSPVPAELAARFVAASLASAAVFWAVLGVAMGWLLHREPATEEAAP